MDQLRNLAEMLVRSVTRAPDKTALMWKENGKYRSLSYSELWQQVSFFASGLHQLGVKQDDKIAIWSDNNYKWPISDFAIFSLGAVTVPIYPTLSPVQATHILEDADITVLIIRNKDYISQFDELPSNIQYIVVMDGDFAVQDESRFEVPKSLTFQAVINLGRDSDSVLDYTVASRDHLATLVYTSGTTGNPKGVMLSHGNLLANVEAISYCVAVSPEDLLVSMLPLSHILERTVVQFLPLCMGATISYAESINTVQQNMQEVRPTVMMSVPRFYEKIYARIQKEFSQARGLKKLIIKASLSVLEKSYVYRQKGFNWAMPRWLKLQHDLVSFLFLSKIHKRLGGRIRFMGSGGASLDPTISRFFHMLGLPIVESYGMTECSPGVCANSLAMMKPGTIGKALPGAQIRVLDDGELVVKSPSVMKGYYKRPSETEETVKDGWLHTGDIAEIDPYGYVRIIDRKKSIIILSNGKNVASQPVENAMMLSNFIHQAVLIGHRRNYVVALIVPDFEALDEYTRGLNQIYSSRIDYTNSPQISELIAGEIEKCLVTFSRFEKPKKIHLLEHEFSIENNELTPTLKTKLPVIEKRYGHIIEQMYGLEVRG